MGLLKCMFAVLFVLLAQCAVFADDNKARPDANAVPQAKPEGEAKAEGKPPAAKPADPFDFAATGKHAAPEQYLELDETIKVQVDPIEPSSVVDRVRESSVVYVRAPGSVRVEVYLEPVDSPYCGRSVGQARLIGRSSDSKRGFPIAWANIESHRYVKIYAKAFKHGGTSFGRSRSIDLAMIGPRYQAPAPHNAIPPTVTR